MSLTRHLLEFKALLHLAPIFVLVLVLMTPNITWAPCGLFLEHSSSFKLSRFFFFPIPLGIWSLLIAKYPDPMCSWRYISNDPEKQILPRSFPLSMADNTDYWISTPQNPSQLNRPRQSLLINPRWHVRWTYPAFLQQSNVIALFSPIPSSLYSYGAYLFYLLWRIIYLIVLSPFPTRF